MDDFGQLMHGNGSSRGASPCGFVILHAFVSPDDCLTVLHYHLAADPAHRVFLFAEHASEA
jgi:hypothetical protein